MTHDRWVPGSRVVRQLPFALLATAAVVALPAVVVALLPGSVGPLVGIPMCVALSLAIARVADALWRRSARSREVLFGDLMLWGWVRRVITERRLAQAESLMTEPTAAAGSRLKAIERVSAMLESRDAYTRRHSLRVTRYSEGIARQLDLARGGDRANPPGRRAARRRQVLHPALHPQQAGAADGGGVRGRQAPPRSGRRSPARRRRARGRGDDPLPPRAPRRGRLSGRAGRRCNSARRAHHRRGGHLRRDDLHPGLPLGAAARARARGPRRGGRRRPRRPRRWTPSALTTAGAAAPPGRVSRAA